jgi:hypothetical protein
MIIFHDPTSIISQQFIASLPTGSYQIVDWSLPANQAKYSGATIRSFPTLVLTMSDGSTGMVDCIEAGITTYAQAQTISTAIATSASVDANNVPIPAVPADQRVVLAPIIVGGVPAPKPTPVISAGGNPVA